MKRLLITWDDFNECKDTEEEEEEKERKVSQVLAGPPCYTEVGAEYEQNMSGIRHILHPISLYLSFILSQI